MQCFLIRYFFQEHVLTPCLKDDTAIFGLYFGIRGLHSAILGVSTVKKLQLTSETVSMSNTWQPYPYWNWMGTLDYFWNYNWYTDPIMYYIILNCNFLTVEAHRKAVWLSSQKHILTEFLYFGNTWCSCLIKIRLYQTIYQKKS